MLTNVQKETIQTLINLYQSSNGNSIKGGEIAEILNRNPGTIRNQMISLRRLGLVKSIPGPTGGYKPTIEAYHTLNIPISEKNLNIPIYKNGEKINGISVAKIEFDSIPKPFECRAAIKVLGSIIDLNSGDEITIGPTPVNNLGIIGTIVGRDDIENAILIDIKLIRSIPKQTVGEIASYDLISFSIDCSVKDAAKKLSDKKIDGAPVLDNGKVVGLFTSSDLVNAVANNRESELIGELMSTEVVIVNKDLEIVNAIDLMLKKSVSRLIVNDDYQDLIGIVTRTDLINDMTNFK